MSESVAQMYVWPHIAKVTPMADNIDAMKYAMHAYTASGYTGMIEMATDDNIWKALQLLKSQENLPFRLAAYWLIRPRIEHLELTTEEDAKRLGRLGITASIQPVHADQGIFGAWPTIIGEHCCGRAFAYKEFQDGGAPIALGTDSPTAPFEPLPNLYTTTTRRSTREPESLETVNAHAALSLASAVSAATSRAAYSCFADKRTGSLRAGLKADFAVLETDWNPKNILAARVIQTWFDGKKVYDANAKS